jgi:protein NrfD
MPGWFLQLLATNPQSGVALPPRWGWYVILYFFVGGMAGGLLAIAAGLELVGDARDQEAVRLAHRLAFPLIIVCALLLIVDLGRPDRFWHMVVMSHRVPYPIFKPWSPISLGTWILSTYGVVAFVAFLDTLADPPGRNIGDGLIIRWGWASRTVEALQRRLLYPARERISRWPRAVRTAWYGLEALSGFALAGYTGVLVVGTSRVAWHNARFMGALFLLSGVSTAYALLMLLLVRRGRRATDSTLRKLSDGDQWTVAMELVVLAVTVISLGSLGRPFWSGGFGVVFWLGVVLVGLLVPLARHWISLGPGERAIGRAAACVLVGGLLLRFVIVMSPQYPRVALWLL